MSNLILGNAKFYSATIFGFSKENVRAMLFNVSGI
jgi:hypothetical protein